MRRFHVTENLVDRALSMDRSQRECCSRAAYRNAAELVATVEVDVTVGD
jgi:hypothetical protein